MTWFPIGPDFVYAPRDYRVTPRRLSRLNEYARQGLVGAIAVEADVEERAEQLGKEPPEREG